jgi:hypothetical protein
VSSRISSVLAEVCLIISKIVTYEKKIAVDMKYGSTCWSTAIDSIRIINIWRVTRKLRRRCVLNCMQTAPNIRLITKTQWPESASELYRPSDRRLLAKLVSTFADRGCHVVSVTDLYGLILGFLDRSRYFFFQVVPQLYSRGWVERVPDPLLLKKSGSAGNRTRTSGYVARNSDH